MTHEFDTVMTGALDIAQTEAIKRKNPALEPVHLLFGLIKNPKSIASKNFKSILEVIENKLELLPVVQSTNFKIESIKPSTSFAQLITEASAHSIQSNRDVITEADILKFIQKFLPNIPLKFETSNHSDEEVSEEKVSDFLVNLNELAKEGKLDPVVGRQKEILAVMEILSRRNKNNPVLVGEAGVGKTAVVEGLADLIVKGKVADTLLGKTIYSLDMGALMAGTKFRGEFEERLKNMMKFIKSGLGNYILFIDELHLLVGAGKTDGAMDAANLLKPALARGELNCIGATTHNEYRQHILSDNALDRRFRLVTIQEPSTEDSIEILLGIKEKFEIHHGIDISDEAIYASVFLSNQYIPDKHLPDKAIDLIDEAASALKLSTEAMPAHLVAMESEIRSKHIFAKTQKNTEEIEKEIASLQADFDAEKKKWEEEVLRIKKHSELKNKIDRLKFEQAKAEAEQDYETASTIKYSTLPEALRDLDKLSALSRLERKHIAAIVARQTGVPVEKILKSKQESILEIEAYLNSRVYGQKEALAQISETLVAAHAGLTDPNRTLASFLLMGPTGVGKTETAKALSQFLFHNEDSIVRFDMSEFSEKHSVAKLIGAPAGYVGYEDGGALTEAIRKQPYAIILFDEIEKAHPDFADILLQLMDDGRLTDNKGQTTSFRNCIVMMTTNATSVEKTFKPEVLGRMDAIISYKPLGDEVVKELIAKETKSLNTRLEDKNISISLSKELMEKIQNSGYDKQYGARPLKSAFAKLVTYPISRLLLQGELKEGNFIAEVPEVGNLYLKKT